MPAEAAFWLETAAAVALGAFVVMGWLFPSERAALVFTLPWMKGDRDPERMLGWSARLVADPEWFIQKGIGWQLRELSKRDPARVRRFLKENGAAMKAFARREAEKYL